MNLARTLVAAVSIATVPVAWSAHDLFVELSLSRGTTLEVGEVEQLRIVLGNRGDEVASGVTARTSFLVTRGFRTAVMFTIAETAPCRIDVTDFVPPPPRPVLFAVTVFPDPAFRDLLPGAQTECIVGLEVAPEAPPAFPFAVSVGSTNPDDDANRTDNLQELILRRAVTPVPTLSLLGLALLGAMTALSGGWRRRRARCQR